MKRLTSIICITAVLLSAAAFSSCSGGTQENSIGGLFSIDKEKLDEAAYEYKYVELSELLKKDEYKDLKEFEELGAEISSAKEEGKKAYACVIEGETPAKLSVPAEYEGNPVLAVVGTSKGCNTLQELTIAEGISAIDGLFKEGNSALESLSVPRTLRGVWNSFNKCPKLQSVSLICTLENLRDSFKDCTGLKSLTMGSLKDARSSFVGCDSLEKAVFEGSVQIIKDYEYENVNTEPLFACSPSLKELVFKGEICDLPSYFAYSTKKLETITINSKQIKIGNSAFAESESIKNVTFGGTVEDIGSFSFYKCYALENIVFNADVNEISSSAFTDSGVKNVLFNGDVGKIEDCFNRDPDSEESSAGKKYSVVFTGKVESIEKCFNYLDSIKEVGFGGSVGTIKESFKEATKLTDVSFRNEVDEIEESFKDCTALKNLSFNGDVNCIDSGFQGCSSLEKVTFGGKLKYLTGLSFCESSDNPVSEKIDYNIIPEDTELNSVAVRDRFDPNAAKLKPFFDKCEQYTYAKVSEFVAANALGKCFPSDKEISPSEASRYADVLNFGVYSDDTHCTDCNVEDYNEEIAQAQMKGNFFDDIMHFYHDVNDENTMYSVFTMEKAEKVMSGDAPLVLGVAESMGYIPVSYTDQDDPDHTETFYYKVFRASLWNIETGELIAWWVYQDGEAPLSFNTRDKYDYMYHENIGSPSHGEYFFNGEYKYPFAFLYQTIFGKPESN